MTSSNNNDKIKTSSGSLNVGSRLFTEDNLIQMLQHERAISANKYETAIIYNEDGSINFQKEGNSDSVIFTRTEIMSMSGKTLTHNHSNGSIHSPEDINIMRRGNLAEIRACNSNGAYVIRHSGKWSSNITSLKKIEDAYNECITEIGMKYLGIAAQEGKSILAYMDRIDYEGLELFCSKYKLEFSWEENHDSEH